MLSKYFRAGAGMVAKICDMERASLEMEKAFVLSCQELESVAAIDEAAAQVEVRFLIYSVTFCKPVGLDRVDCTHGWLVAIIYRKRTLNQRVLEMR